MSVQLVEFPKFQSLFSNIITFLIDQFIQMFKFRCSLKSVNLVHGHSCSVCCQFSQISNSVFQSPMIKYSQNSIKCYFCWSKFPHLLVSWLSDFFKFRCQLTFCMVILVIQMFKIPNPKERLHSDLHINR